MATTTVSTTSAGFAPPVPASYTTLVLSALRLLGMLLTYENPFLWSIWMGRRNQQADVEGPFYVLDAPSRQIEEGKAIMANSKLLAKYVPYLMTVRILTAKGEPIPGATLDWWQADSEGNYYFSDYTLRGRVTTNSDGYAEVLSVVPGFYGLGQTFRRSGHFHVWIRPPQELKNRWDDLTTQMYVCPANDAKHMNGDFVNYMRKVRECNMVKSWSIPSATEGKRYLDFPELPADDVETRKRLDWWDAKLSEASDLKVAAGAFLEVRLNTKTRWL